MEGGGERTGKGSRRGKRQEIMIGGEGHTTKIAITRP
jgi:hypothetical protein